MKEQMGHAIFSGMTHLLNLAILVSFSTALLGVYSCHVRIAKHQLAPWVSLRGYFTCLAVLILLNFLYGYQLAVLGPERGRIHGVPYMLFLVYLCVPVYTWYLLRFMYGLIHRKVPRYLLLGGLLITLLIYPTYVLSLFFKIFPDGVDLSSLFEIPVNGLSLACLLSVALVVRARLMTTGKKSTLAIRRMLVGMGVAFGAVLVDMILFWGHFIPRLVYLVILAIIWGLINALILVFLPAVAEHCPAPPTGSDPSSLMGVLRERYGVTAREFEIITLVAQGRSNQEISDLLFIGLQTVKDHNSRIFRKMNLDNRVQLIRKVHELIRE